MGESNDHFVIVGAGHGAGQAVATLRSKGFEGRITLIGEEPYVPYQRPPLSKAFLAGSVTLDRLYFKPTDFYATKNVELMLSTKATAIDREKSQVILHDGRHVDYDKLLIMTGTRVRKLNIPGADLPGVNYLRTIEDVDHIREHVAPGAKMAVIGGGYIGMEVAAVAVKLGLEVTVIEALDRILSRGVGERVSQFFHDLHTSEGVAIRTGTGVTAFEGTGKLERVVCADGSTVEADVAVVGIGVVPNQEIAEEAGLAIDNGIVVDEFCRTNDPNIFAAGDCTNHPNDLMGTRLRLESVHNALEQAKTAAAAMCGELKAYSQVPWFWSDQYNVKFQKAGLSDEYTELVLRGEPDPETRKFAAFYLKDGVVVAVDAINAVAEYMVGRKLIAAHAKVPADKLADLNVNIKELV